MQPGRPKGVRSREGFVTPTIRNAEDRIPIGEGPGLRMNLTGQRVSAGEGRSAAESDEAMARRVGRALASFLGAKRLVVGRDARPHSPAIASAAIEGMRDEGAAVVDIGLASTPMAYFAIATLPCDGGLNVTASH